MGFFGPIRQGLVFVVSAPAGAGKTTLTQKLLNEHPESVVRSISCTTRLPRGAEKQGVDYFFLTEAEFEKKVEEGAFLEYQKVFNHYYGTLKQSVSDAINQGKHIFLVIDIQGALKIKQEMPAIFVFIMPPSHEALNKRLCQRGTDSEESIRLRLSRSQEEIEQAKYYDCVIMNDNLETAYHTFKAFICQKEQELCEYLS